MRGRAGRGGAGGGRTFALVLPGKGEGGSDRPSELTVSGRGGRRVPAAPGPGATRGCSVGGLLPVRRHSPTIPLLGDTEDLPGGRGLVLRRGAQAEVIQDPADGELIGQESDRLHLLAAACADERIHLVHLGDQARPAGWAAATSGLGGRLGEDIRSGACGHPVCDWRTGRRGSCGAVPDPGCGRSCGRATRADPSPRSYGRATGSCGSGRARPAARRGR